MDEVDSLRSRLFHEDSVSLAPSTAEPINPEDSHYATLRGDLEGDAQDLEAESWSLAMDQDYMKGLHKEAIKRQDVIYELMQTEMHHVRTLKVLRHVYMHELRESLQMDEGRLERLFPALEVLLVLHLHFLQCLKLRREQSLREGDANNYQITQLGDVLIAQFSGELGERMKECYAVFCSRHSDSVSLYKELFQNNKKFQNLMRKIGQLSIVRRLGIPECFLLVTQRITKYPVLLERIIQNTEAETEEHGSLVQALALIKDTISQVDSRVNDYEKAARLREIGLRLEPKSQGRLKDGRLFRREDLVQGSRTMLHEATFTMKALSGRHKDIFAVLLTDVLLLLQEKDQKLVFAAVDNKPPVISLQRMIVREVAHNDKAMFLICASSSIPEMYEIHTGSRDERNTWITLIRQAVDSCPEGEEELYSEQEARAARLREFQEHLMKRDVLIVQNLTEKLQIFAALAGASTAVGTTHTRLALREDSEDLQQGETLLKGAIREVENLQNLLLSRMRDSAAPAEESQGALVRRAQTFAWLDIKPTASPVKNGELSEVPAPSSEGDPQQESAQLPDSDSEPEEPVEPEEPDRRESLELSADGDPQTMTECDSTPNAFPVMEFFDRVLMLSQRLYSLQAFIAQQDSRVEVQRALLAERERPPARHRSDVLLEQEKQRNLEKQKEELASFQRLQAQHRQEQQRWEKECERSHAQAEALEARLLLREEECRRLEQRLSDERAELERQRETYQQDLERLREAAQKVEKEKERLEQQKKFKKHKAVANPLHFDHDKLAQLGKFLQVSHSQSFHSNVGKEAGGLVRPPAADLAPGDTPPTVPPRKESISPQPAKAEVPLHLISTTNQAHKGSAVQQQIPTKLAALSKAKEKNGRSSRSSRASHQRTHSAASIDMSQVVPIKVTGKEGGSLRAKRSSSPPRIHQHLVERFNPPRIASNMKPSQSFSVHKRSGEVAPPEPPPFPKDLVKPEKEPVIFL